VKRFTTVGQRVLVRAVVPANKTPKLAWEPLRLLRYQTGTVRRLRNGDDGAWVELDARVVDEENVHPFPAPGANESDVVTFPRFCSALTKTRRPSQCR
jgi:hypothetical protein